jgi:small subunit ribosomal protein S13
MSYILGANLSTNSKVRIALTLIYGIGSSKALQICDQLGLSDNVRVHQLTRIQIDQMTKLITQNHLIDPELKRLIYNDIKRLRQIGSYRGLRHSAGLPLRGQRTHTNAKTCIKFKKNRGAL